VNVLRINQFKLIVLVALTALAAVTGGGMFDGISRF
jgi:hypothetical protein